MQRVRYLSMICAIFVIVVASVAADSHTPAGTALEIENVVLETVTSEVLPGQGDAVDGLATSDVDVVEAAAALCIQSDIATAMARKASCALAEAKCLSKALNKVTCPLGEEVCQGPGEFIDSCVLKPAGDYKAHCHVEWTCTLTP